MMRAAILVAVLVGAVGARGSPQAPAAQPALAVPAQAQQPQQQPLAVFGGAASQLAASLNNSSALADMIHSVGKVIQQGTVHIVQQQQQPGVQSPASALAAFTQQLAAAKKNEYTALLPASLETTAINNATNYKQQGEQLRAEIVKRAGQLQQVVASSLELLKSNSDLIVRRLLEQMNARLDIAKAKADKILNEPATNEVAIRALHTINHGLNNLNNIITNIAARLDAHAKEAAAGASLPNQGAQNQTLATQAAQRQLLDPNKIRANLAQLGQQFSSALQAAQMQQRLAANNATASPLASLYSRFRQQQ